MMDDYQIFGLVVVVLLVLLVVVVLVKSVALIPQAEAAVIERLGRYTRTASGQLTLLLPFIDRIRARVDIRERVVSFPPQPVITEDNLTLSIDTVVYFQVTNPRSAVYEIDDYIAGVEQLTITFTLEYVRGGRLGRSSAVRGVARQSPVVAGGLAWKVTPDRDGSFRPLIEMCSRTCRCVKVCRRNHPDEPTAHGRTVWTKRSG
ncbi:hypothetical protein BPODLACK_01686 [Gordonia sp. YY1]|nr:hypothetical protein BPODLACK_01686 [Gordonia sp. YY1]